MSQSSIDFKDELLIEKTLCKIFPTDWLERTARETGLIKRERKIHPAVMFWVMVLSYGVQLQHTLAELKREYERRDGTADTPWTRSKQRTHKSSKQ